MTLSQSSSSHGHGLKLPLQWPLTCAVRGRARPGPVGRAVPRHEPWGLVAFPAGVDDRAGEEDAVAADNHAVGGRAWISTGHSYGDKDADRVSCHQNDKCPRPKVIGVADDILVFLNRLYYYGTCVICILLYGSCHSFLDELQMWELHGHTIPPKVHYSEQIKKWIKALKIQRLATFEI